MSALELEADAVVVGAGLSGLACARDLVAAGRSVIVIEARDRVGGRTWSTRMGRATFDLGGQWIGPGQQRVQALARALSLETFPTHHEGTKVLSLGGKRSTYEGSIPSLPVVSLIELQSALMKVERVARRVPVEDPCAAPDASSLDGSLEDWKRRAIWSPAVRAVFDAAVRVVFGAEPRDLSVLWFLAYLRAGGGLMKLVEIQGGAQERRFVDGAQGLSLGLAARLGDRVILGSPVRSIVQDEREVVVRSDRATIRAKRAVVAVPPPLAARIEYGPALPPVREQLGHRMPMGATVKCFALYDHAFWRARGLSGEAVLDDGPLSVVFDNGSHDGAQPALLGFIVGQEARRWSALPESARRGRVLAVLERCFGPEAARPTAYFEQDWSTEAWTRGCPVASFTPGAVLSCADALRRPFRRIHWAGTETAVEWTGYMEGALEAGERAAREVIGLT